MLTDNITPEAINDILSSLSPSDMENLTRLASDFFSAPQTKEKEEQKDKQSAPPFNLDMDTVMRIASLMNKLSSQPEDPRCRLLRDLKPMLSAPRRKKVDSAIQLMQMMSLMPLIKELG